MKGHQAMPEILEMVWVKGIDHRIPKYAPTCSVCGRPVRRMTGLGPGVFYHAGRGRPKRKEPTR